MLWRGGWRDAHGAKHMSWSGDTRTAEVDPPSTRKADIDPETEQPCAGYLLPDL
jgi:hypothetical protein